MTVSHVELYEALKGPVGEKGARMIADIVPPAADIARRQDVFASASDIRREFGQLVAEMQRQFTEVHRQFAEVNKQFAEVNKQFGEVRVEMHALNARTIRWILGVTVPLWIGTWGMMAAVLLRTQ